MAKATIAIDPVTRIEGHLKAQVVVENGKVADAHLTGGMFRGFEQILKGRDPRDSTQIVQRQLVRGQRHLHRLHRALVPRRTEPLLQQLEAARLFHFF